MVEPRCAGPRPTISQGSSPLAAFVVLPSMLLIGCTQPPIVGTSCGEADDCSGGLICIEGECAQLCNSGFDCDASQWCIDGVCWTPAAGTCPCCDSPTDCATNFDRPAVCFTVAGSTDCQGGRVDATCIGHVCGSVAVDDDSACFGSDHPCPDDFASISCLALEDQPTPQCPTACTADTDCRAGYTCVAPVCQLICNTGYVASGSQCVDINECTTGSDNCDVNAACTNSTGSFDCDCNSGYAGDGTACSDVNECGPPSTDNCAADATCTNTIGGYTCACNSRFEGDGFTCTPVVGSVASNPGSSCKAILDAGASVGDQAYWVDSSGIGATEVFCDMTTDGGGWQKIDIYPGSVGTCLLDRTGFSLADTSTVRLTGVIENTGGSNLAQYMASTSAMPVADEYMFKYFHFSAPVTSHMMDGFAATQWPQQNWASDWLTPLNESGSASANVAQDEYAVTIASRLTASIEVYLVGVNWTNTGTLSGPEKSAAWTPTAELFYGSNCQYDNTGPPVADIAGFVRN